MDSLIPMMRSLNESSAKLGVKEIKIGMAHRGRINMLVNVLGQPSKDLFSEFDGTRLRDDVWRCKYHRGTPVIS